MNKLKILHLTTHNEECGIAKYNEQLIAAIDADDDLDISNDIFDVSPNVMRFMPAQELTETISRLIQQAEQSDILHIQHELSFFKQNELDQILTFAQNRQIKTIVTVHTAPNVQLRPEKLGGLGPRSLVKVAKDRRFNRNFINRYYKPLSMATQILVPNNVTKEALEAVGVQTDIQVFTHHIPNLSFDKKAKLIDTQLRASAKDVVFCTVGFITPAKGVLQAVKALNFLPENYKLAIIGGAHPKSESDEFYDEVADTIVQYGLQERVYITGYIKEDDELNALIRECDISVYPYNTAYYGYVSSAALNNAIANYMPAIVYPTRSFLEINKQQDVLAVCDSPNYYELARKIKSIDTSDYKKRSKDFATAYAVGAKAHELAAIYESVARS